MLSTEKRADSASCQIGRFQAGNCAKIARAEAMKRLSLAERALARVQQLVSERGFSHEALAPHLEIGPSAVSKILSGKNALGLDHIEGFCVALQISPSELLLEPGSLIQPLTPLESQLLHHFRQMTELQRHSLLSILDSSPRQPGTRRRARLGRAELTEEQQLVVDLYARSPEQARGGILKTLRGTAQLGDAERGQRQKTE